MLTISKNVSSLH